MNTNEDKQVAAIEQVPMVSAPVDAALMNAALDLMPKMVETSQDPVLYEAWRSHMITGFKQNNHMFKSILNAFMRPYNMTVAMYVVMFLVGIGGFAAAIVMAAQTQFPLAALFGGMSVVSLLTFFLSRPLRSLEKNLLFITWLGVIYNTYWTRLMYTTNPKTVQQDMMSIAKSTIAQIDDLVGKHESGALKRKEK